MNNSSEAYQVAQSALANLKAAIRYILEAGPDAGLTNAELGRMLGIYGGHVGHEGHISRTLLAVMATEGVVSQDSSTKRWKIRAHHQASESEAIENSSV